MTVFKSTLRPILIFSQFLGLINISYTLESTTGLLFRYKYSTIYLLLELVRTCVLVTCTYIICAWEFFYFFETILLLKFWFVIIAARLSEKWIIKLINGIIEFDQRIVVLSTHLSVQQHSLSKRYFYTVYILLLVYFIGFEIYQLYLWPPKIINIYSTIHFLFKAPFIMDFNVLISSFFFLLNFNNRFQTLLDFFKFLPVESDFPNDWTHSEIAMSLEKIRILHAELSELLKIFSLSYGPLLLSFFVFNFINLLIQFFLLICITLPTSNVSSMKASLRPTLPHILNVQIIIFTMSIIVAVSLIHDKVKMFMLQLSFFEMDEISSYGFFNINLNIVLSTIVLLITGLITLIQMKKHTIILNMVNNILTFGSDSLSNWIQLKL